MKRFALLATTAALSLALAACGGGQHEEAPAPEANIANVEDAPVEPVENIATEAPPAPRIDNTADVAVPDITLSDAEQTQDDADATGMTARVSREESNDSATVPAE